MAQGLILRVKNNTGIILTAGKVVRISGLSQTDQLTTIELASNNDPLKMPAVGIVVEDIDNGATGVVRINGIFRGIDTSGQNINAIVFVGNNGEVIFTDPTVLNSSILTQKLGVVLTSAIDGQVLLSPLEISESLEHRELSNLNFDDHLQYILASAAGISNIAFFTNNRTIGGTSNLSWNNVSKKLTLSDGSIKSPSIILESNNNAITPTLAFGDGDTGFYESADDFVSLSVAQTLVLTMSSTGMLFGSAGDGPIIRNITASATVPGFSPSGTDTNTGVGTAGADILSLIAGSVEGIRVTTVSGISTTQFSGVYWSPVADIVTPTGTTQTLDLSTSNSFIIDLASASGDVTLTLSNPEDGALYVIKVIQDISISRNIIWPSEIIWPSGSAPIISAGSQAEDIIRIWHDGSNFYGTFDQNFS